MLIMKMFLMMWNHFSLVFQLLRQLSTSWNLYTKKELQTLCKKSIFKKLLIKLTKEWVTLANNHLIKQIDGCPVGGPISVVFSDIYMCKMEEDIVKPLNPIFYKHYMGDRYDKRKRNEADTLFVALNSYHPNTRFTLEQNPKKFLDTQISHYWKLKITLNILLVLFTKEFVLVKIVT